METNYIEPEGFKGTPGRWKFEPHETGRYYGNVVGSYGLGENGIENIRTITIQLGNAGQEENKANAMLITHAKELLAAAQEALKELQYHNWHQTKTGLELRSAINAALGINE